MNHGLRLTLPAHWRLDDATIDMIGRIGTFAITFALGWAVMLWAWGGWVGGLMGWIPALVLATILASIWMMVLAGGATLMLLLVMARVL
jgi:hypothetical protein